MLLEVDGHVFIIEGKVGGFAEIRSDIHESDDSDELEAALDAVEGLILAHYVAGVDVGSPQYIEGVSTTLDAIFHNL